MVIFFNKFKWLVNHTLCVSNCYKKKWCSVTNVASSAHQYKNGIMALHSGNKCAFEYINDTGLLHTSLHYFFKKGHVPKDQDLTKPMLFLLFYQDVLKWNWHFIYCKGMAVKNINTISTNFAPDSICTKMPNVQPKIALYCHTNVNTMKWASNAFWLYKCPESQGFPVVWGPHFANCYLYHRCRFMAFLYTLLVLCQLMLSRVKFKDD